MEFGSNPIPPVHAALMELLFVGQNVRTLP